jgi:hypothetical protein
MTQLLVALFLVASWVASGSGLDLSRQASALLQQGKQDEALIVLQSIHGSPEAESWALSQAVKVFYSKQRWPRFFGLSAYVRTQYSSLGLADDVRLLEILALLRHCRNDDAVALVRVGLAQGSSASRPRYEMLASLLEVAPTPPDERPQDESSDPQAPRKMFASKHLWPVPVQAVPKLDPWKLERKIDPQCEKGASK